MFYMTNRIVIKIGQNSDEDLKKIFENPQKNGRPGTHTIYLKKAEGLQSLLSPERLRLLAQLINYNDEPDVSNLSKKLMRSQEAISRDLKKLEENGLVTKTKKGKNVYPKLNAKEIVIKLA